MAGATARVAHRPDQDHGQRRLPSGLLRRAIEAYNKGGIGVRVLARLAEIPPELLLEQLSPLPPVPDSEDEPDHIPVV